MGEPKQFLTRLGNGYIVKCGEMTEDALVFLSIQSALFYVVKLEHTPTEEEIREMMQDGYTGTRRRYYFADVPRKYRDVFNRMYRRVSGDNLWWAQRMPGPQHETQQDA